MRIVNIIYKKITLLFTTLLIIVSVINNISGADITKTNKFKFSDIDLIIDVPDELISFTRQTTNNNSYLDLIGVSDAEELVSLMRSSHAYLEAVDKDVKYEIVVAGQKAGNGIEDFNNISEDRLKELYNAYVEQNKEVKNNSVSETITNSEIKKINGISYIVTDITSVSVNTITVYIKKFYTVMQGNAYTFTLQTNGGAIEGDMVDYLQYIISSANYTPVKASIFENSFVSQLLSYLITIGLPMLVLGIIFYFLVYGTKKKNSELANEETRLRQEYKESIEKKKV